MKLSLTSKEVYPSTEIMAAYAAKMLTIKGVSLDGGKSPRHRKALAAFINSPAFKRLDRVFKNVIDALYSRLSVMGDTQPLANTMIPKKFNTQEVKTFKKEFYKSAKHRSPTPYMNKLMQFGGPKSEEFKKNKDLQEILSSAISLPNMMRNEDIGAEGASTMDT